MGLHATTTTDIAQNIMEDPPLDIGVRPGTIVEKSWTMIS
jgi:hypothetical protein